MPTDSNGIGAGAQDSAMPDKADLYPHLDAEFSDYLRARGVPPDVARDRGYQLVKPGKPLDGTYSQAWGFPRKSSGMLIPLYGLLDDDDTGRSSVQLRHDAAVLALNPKWPKFRTPQGQKNVLATSPRTRHLLQEDRQIIFIGEGITRIDALAPFDVPGVATTGVWSWRSNDSTLTDLRSLKVKENKFVVGPDGDVETKSQRLPGCPASGAASGQARCGRRAGPEAPRRPRGWTTS